MPKRKTNTALTRRSGASGKQRATNVERTASGKWVTKKPADGSVKEKTAKSAKKSAGSGLIGASTRISKNPTSSGVKETAGSPIAPFAPVSMKIRKIGNSLGVILPRDILNALGVEEGDTIDVVQTEDGRIELAVVDREADDLMSMAEDIMAENRAVLRALAK